MFQKPEACNFVKKETLAQVLSFDSCQISKISFFAENLWTTASVVLTSLIKIKEFIY